MGFDVPVPKDWHGKAELRSVGWCPFWCWDSVEDCVKDVDLDPCEDVDADLIKRNPDRLHDVVPEVHDVVWDEPKDVDDPFDDWPEDLDEDAIDVPPDAPEVVMKPHEEAKDDEE